MISNKIKKLQTTGNRIISYRLSKSDNHHNTLVFLHGLGGDLTAWDFILKDGRFDSFNTLTVDLFGHGDSGRPINFKDSSIHQMAEDVKMIMEKENLKNCVLAGHCLGGMVAIELLIVYPNLFNKAILINTSASIPWFGGILRIPFAQEVLLFMSNNLPELFPHQRADHRKFWNTGNYSFPRLFSDMKNTGLGSYFKLLVGVSRFNRWKDLSRITTPVYVISSENDTIYPPSVGEKLSQGIVHSEFNIIKGGSHVIVLSDYYKQLSKMINKYQV